jgi:geranylgeranyl diphosphate synthase type II
MTLTDRIIDQPANQEPFEGLPALRQALDARMGAHLAVSAAPPHLMEALRDATLAPGKRMRPVVLNLVCHGTAAPRTARLDAGCAVEMVHTASLILDDLPCMDNASLRRNRPATHVAFGQATAILGAIALLNQAFALLAALDGVPEATRTRLSRILAQAVGWEGLVAGQELDVNGQDGLDTVEQVETLNWLKTGVLFVAAVEMGAVLAGCSERQIDHLKRFATNLGQAFQVADDLLDKTASSTAIGKDVDQDADKTTIVSLLGIEGARSNCQALLQRADAALVASGVSPEPVRSLIAEFFASAAKAREAKA